MIIEKISSGVELMKELKLLEWMWAERSSRKPEACEKLNDQMALQSISQRSSLKLYGMCVCL